MSLFTLKEKITDAVKADKRIKHFYSSRYTDASLKYTALIFEILEATDGNKYKADFEIRDKLPAKNNGFEKIQSDTLLIIKSLMMDLSALGILDYTRIIYKPIVNGDEAGWSAKGVTLAERRIYCVQ